MKLIKILISEEDYEFAADLARVRGQTVQELYARLLKNFFRRERNEERRQRKKLINKICGINQKDF